MAKLVIEHPDFVLEIKSDNAYGAFLKARATIGQDALHSTYSFSTSDIKVKSVGMPYAELFSGVNQQILSSLNGNPFFFDYTEYFIIIIFKKDRGAFSENSTFIQLMNNPDQCVGDYHPEGGFITGFINYQNDIGNSGLILNYKINQELKTFSFSYQVLSQKLDYHKHWKCIVNDIENEYRMLAFDYLRQTFHNFKENYNNGSSDLIWWNLFKEKHYDFIKACRFILSKPRNKFNRKVSFSRVDQLKYLTPQLENEYVEYRNTSKHYYCTQQSVTSHDTTENRFLKYAIKNIRTRFVNIASIIQTKYPWAYNELSQINAIKKDLNYLYQHPFFHSIGNFTGMNQESLILQRAPGYSTVAQIFILLKASYCLSNGIFSIDSKNIAELYEIWCFLQVRNIIKELFAQSSDQLEIKDLNRQEIDKRFNYSLHQGQKSQIIFSLNGIEIAELYYNFQTSENQYDGISQTIVPSGVAQRPDIILQLTRKFMDKQYKLTYLFDAKYRLNNDKCNGFDQPPDDAINQMHRYRDAIYYNSPDDFELKKEIIGGYILFPGNGTAENLERQRFFKSISEINIGAFPLKPEETNREYLKKFIKKLLSEDVYTHMQKSTTYKGMRAAPVVPSAMHELFIYYTIFDEKTIQQINQEKKFVLSKNNGHYFNVSAKNAPLKKWIFIEIKSYHIPNETRIFSIIEFSGIHKINNEENYVWQIQ